MALCTLFSTMHAQWLSLPTTPSRTVAHLKGSKDNTLVVENAGKILLSTNAGNAWEDITANLPANFRIPAVVVGEASLIGIDYHLGKVVRYDVESKTWHDASSGLPPTGFLKFLVATSERVLVLSQNFSTGESPTIFVSSDLGTSWIPADNGLSPDFEPAILESMNGGNKLLLIGTQADEQVVYFSNDQGSSWQLGSTFDTPCDMSYVVTDGAHTVLAKSNCGNIYISFDSGSHWHTTTDLPENLNVISLVRMGKALFINGTYDVEGYLYKKIFRSYNGGTTFTPLSVPFDEKDFMGKLGVRHTILSVVKNGQLLLSTNMGASFHPVQGLEKNDFLMAPDYHDNGVIQVLSGDGGIFIGQYHGLFWKDISQGLTKSAFPLAELYPSGECLIATMLRRPHVLCSTDGGQSWSMSSVNGAVRQVTRTPSGLFAVISRSGKRSLIRSIDDGKNWIDVQTYLPEGQHLYAIASYGNRLFAGTRGNVLVSTDLGYTWKPWLDSGALGSQDVISLAHDPANRTMYAGTSSGEVFKMVKNDPDAELLGSGVGASDLVFDRGTLFAFDGLTFSRKLSGQYLWLNVHNPAFSQAIRAASSSILLKRGNILLSTGGGVVRSEDHGLSFTPWSEGLPPGAQATSISTDGKQLYVTIADHGIFTRSIEELPVPPMSAEDNNWHWPEADVMPYPNPADDEMFVSYTLPQVDGGATISLVNLSGQVMAKKYIGVEGTGKVTFPLDECPPGMYYLQLSDGHRMKSTSVRVQKR